MSITAVFKGAEVRRRVMAQSCDRCDAKAGEHCITKTGRRHSHWHGARWFSAVRSGQVPVFYQDGEPLP